MNVYDVGPNDGAKHNLKHIKQILTDDIHTFMLMFVAWIAVKF